MQYFDIIPLIVALKAALLKTKWNGISKQASRQSRAFLSLPTTGNTAGGTTRAVASLPGFDKKALLSKVKIPYHLLPFLV